MADRNDEEILRAILEKGSDKAKQQAAAAIAQQPPTPADPPVVKEQKKKRKGLSKVAGALGKQKFYYGPGGTIVDKEGVPAPETIAAALRSKDNMFERIREAVPKATSSPAKMNAVNSELRKIISGTSAIARSHDKVLQKMPELFNQIDLAMRNLIDKHHMIVEQLVKQNEELQDKVIEALTGAKAPTRAGGAVSKPKRGSAARAVGASRAAGRRPKLRETNRAAVMARRERILQAREDRNRSSIKKMAALGAIGGLAAGAAYRAVTGGGGAGPSESPAPAAPPPSATGTGAGAGGYSGPGVAATGNAREAIDFFVSKGWTKEQAIGLVANLEAESGFKTNVVGDRGKAYGIAQWHPDRQARFRQVYGKDIRQSNFREQLEFVNWELNNTEKRAGNILRQAQEAGNAAALVDQYYERSSGIHRQKRILIAQKYARGEIPGAGATQAGVGAQQAGPATQPTPPPGTPPGAMTPSPGTPGAQAQGQPTAAPAAAGIIDYTSRTAGRFNFGQLGEKKGFIVHHTAGRGTVDGVITTFMQRNYPTQYIIDREGRIYRVLPAGSRGQHMRTGTGKGEGLSNANTEGVEVIARDDSDVLPVQVEAVKRLVASLGYTPQQVFGHGEVNSHKQSTEGMSSVSAIRGGGLPNVARDQATGAPTGGAAGAMTPSPGTPGAGAEAPAAAGMAAIPPGVAAGALAPSPGTPGAAGAPAPTGERPSNLQVGSAADLSKVDPDLLKRLYAAVKEYGQPVRINSAYRGDEYQAQLWVRANVYREPGIYSPARPAQTVTITYKGRQHTVQGSGRGSAHGRGQAVDISPGPALDPFLRKYGLHRPHASFDPPHVEKIGGSNYQAPSSPGAPAGAPAAPTAVAQGKTMAEGSARQAMAENARPQGPQLLVMNNNRTMMHTKTVHRGSSLQNTQRPNTGRFNPFDVVATAAAGFAMGRAMRLF